MRFDLKDIMVTKCINLYSDVLRHGKLNGGSIDVPDAIANEILAKCSEPPPVAKVPSNVIPYEKWALPLRLLSRLNGNKEDKGLGDTIERVIGPIGGEAFKRWWKHTTGSDCGCAGRKEWLNEHYPYTKADLS